MSKATKSKPYVSNYPVLQEWLDKIEARCLWQCTKGAGLSYVEGWQAPNGQLIIVQVFANNMGWNIFTAETSGRVDAALADAEKRLGLH